MHTPEGSMIFLVSIRPSLSLSFALQRGWISCATTSAPAWPSRASTPSSRCRRLSSRTSSPRTILMDGALFQGRVQPSVLLPPTQCFVATGMRNGFRYKGSFLSQTPPYRGSATVRGWTEKKLAHFFCVFHPFANTAQNCGSIGAGHFRQNVPRIVHLAMPNIRY